MLLRFPLWVDLGLDVGVWTVWGLGIGLLGARWPDRRLRRDGRITTLRRAERDGRLYRRLGIRRWKRALPDLGRFAGGRSKRPGPTRDAERWVQLSIDCRRAELVHWLAMTGLPVVLVWSGGILGAAMVTYALVANVPCIAAQRYNRARLSSLAPRTTAAVGGR